MTVFENTWTADETNLRLGKHSVPTYIPLRQRRKVREFYLVSLRGTYYLFTANPSYQYSRGDKSYDDG